MNKRILVFCLLALALMNPNQIWAQRNKKGSDGKAKKVVISDFTRQQSAKFADGLRDFYSDNFEMAENTFRQILDKDAKNDAAAYMLARIYKTKKKYPDAMTFLQTALKIDKSNVWYKVEMAEVYSLMNDYKNSAKLWEEICKLKPENEYYLINLSEAYISGQEYGKVIDVYDRFEVLNGYNDEITSAKVELWLYLNDVKGALGEYDKLIKEFPNEARYYVLAGNICTSNNLPDKALAYYQKALEINPNNAMANLAMGDYYLARQNDKAAFESMVVAFKDPEIDIENKLPFLKKYLLKAVKIMNAEAIEQCELLADYIAVAHPDHPEGWATLASISMLKKDYAKARSNFETALSIEQSTYSLWEDYFYCLSIQNDFKGMIEKGKEVLELYPTNAAMLYNIANAYYQEQQYNESIKLLQQALVYSYDNNLLANIYNILGDCYEGLGNADEAVKNWKMALKKGLNTQEKISILENKK